MHKALLLLLSVSVLASCGVSKRLSSYNNRLAFDGMYYKARLSAEKGDRQTFTISVGPVSQGLDGAREAGRYEATKHCVEYFGNSAVDWAAGPDAEEDALSISDDKLQLAGRCLG